MSVQLSEEQLDAVKVMLSGRNVFLGGKAGVGKSTTIGEFVKRCGRSCVVLAPTGVAALNAGGATLHSFFQLPTSILTPDLIYEVSNPKKRDVIRAAKTIVIDEISMVRSDLFNAVDFRLRELAKGANRDKVFGGKQVIVVGDFYQLPPVVKGEKTRQILEKLYGGIYAFQTNLWKRAGFVNITLKTVHRQAKDMRFVELLNCVREGDLVIPRICDSECKKINACEAFEKYCPASKILAKSAVKLCLTNREADRINDYGQRALRERGQSFEAEIKGRFNESDFPTENILTLAVGARVMVLANKRLPDGTTVHVNGDMGTVMGFGHSDTGETVLVNLDRGCSYVSVERWTWERFDYELGRNSDGAQVLERRTVGSFTQIPLRLAYAITVHKAQGLSLDCVDLRLGSGCFAHGQLYTALSRCKSLDNLRIDRRIMPEDLMLDPEVVEFYQTMQKPRLEVEMRIPVEYEDEVRRFLAQLQAR